MGSTDKQKNPVVSDLGFFLGGDSAKVFHLLRIVVIVLCQGIIYFNLGFGVFLITHFFASFRFSLLQACLTSS